MTLFSNSDSIKLTLEDGSLRHCIASAASRLLAVLSLLQVLMLAAKRMVASIFLPQPDIKANISRPFPKFNDVTYYEPAPSRLSIRRNLLPPLLTALLLPDQIRIFVWFL